MTAKKYISGDVHPDDANGTGSTEIPASQPAEVEKDVVGEAKPAERTDAVSVAQTIADVLGSDLATANGNRVTITGTGPNGLVQTFHATVEEGIREF